MKKLIICFFLFLTLVVGGFADSLFHTFGANPVVHGGLTVPAPGSEFVIVPQNIPDVRMWGASGESSVKTFPAGIMVEAHHEQISGQNMWVATRVVCCGNPVSGLVWPVQPPQQIQQQQQQQQINVTVIFQQPSQPADRTLYMDAIMLGVYGTPTFLNVGAIEKKTVTWSSTNIKNSATGGAGGAGGAGGDSSSSSASSSTANSGSSSSSSSGVNSTIIVESENGNTINNIKP